MRARRVGRFIAALGFCLVAAAAVPAAAPETVRARQSRALEQLAGTLWDTYLLEFKTRAARWWLLAWRCPDRAIDAHELDLRRFFEAVYPRFFRHGPAAPWRVVYFAGKAEFRRATRQAAYGYYLPGTRTIVTYSGSGAGTLWHELVHAFLRDNTRGADGTPRDTHQWFSEGFASFYERAVFRDGALVEGWANWRHPALAAAVRAGRDVPLRDFLAEATMRAAVGAAQARFFFCYLWVKGVMDDFVRAYLYGWRPMLRIDEIAPRAIVWLEKRLGKPLADIQAEFRALVLATRMDQKLVQSGPR